MSSRGRASIQVGAILVLVVCACNLVFHFMAEGLLPVSEGPDFDLVMDAGHVHLVHEHGDDNFILVSLIPSPLEHFSISLPCTATSVTLSYSVSPLLPPPNF